MSICPNKSSMEWKLLVDNLKIYMIELDMYKNDTDVENHAFFAYASLATGEIPNPVQGMRLILKHHLDKQNKFEEYISRSKRQDNIRWRIKSLPPREQEYIRQHAVINAIMIKRGESKEFIDKFHKYLYLYNKSNSEQ